MPKKYLLHIEQSIIKSLSKLSQSIVTRISIHKGHLLRGSLVGVDHQHSCYGCFTARTLLSISASIS